MDYNSLPNFYAALDAKYNVTNNELNTQMLIVTLFTALSMLDIDGLIIRKDSLLFWLRKSSMNTN